MNLVRLIWRGQFILVKRVIQKNLKNIKSKNSNDNNDESCEDESSSEGFEGESFSEGYEDESGSQDNDDENGSEGNEGNEEKNVHRGILNEDSSYDGSFVYECETNFPKIKKEDMDVEYKEANYSCNDEMDDEVEVICVQKMLFRKH